MLTSSGEFGVAEESTSNHLECCVCLAAKRNILFEPCNHVAVCQQCDTHMKVSRKYQCPVCREAILRSQKVFL